MIYIKKQAQPPQVFLDAVAGLTSYNELQGEQKEVVINILLAEQGGLCAICERLRTRFHPTIEHFLPQSIFPLFQLNYFNLYGTCQHCNGPKAHHLIPPYIFDPRFNPFNEINNPREGMKPVYHLIDHNSCEIIIPAAVTTAKKILSQHHSAYMLQASLDLMQQNRYRTQESLHGSNNSLLLNRATVWNTIAPKLQQLSDEDLIAKFTGMSQQDTYPEFVSLIVYLYSKEFRRRNINIGI